MDNLENNISNIAINHYKYLMNLENVNGVALSYKYIKGINTFEPCISVLVENKVSSKFLTSNNIIPKNYMGIKTDVIAIGKPSMQDIDGGVIFFKMRPLEAGCVIGSTVRYASGTMCCIVKKSFKKGIFKKTKYYILSNNHVLANRNQNPIGTKVIQPSLVEKGDASSDVVAILDTFIPMKFIEDDEEAENLVDAGIAEIFDSHIISNKIFPDIKIKGTTEPALLMSVKKIGYKTGETSGNIRAVNASVSLKVLENNSAVFKNQIISELRTRGGDSGSPIFTANNELVGMHMAGGIDGFSIANNINIVLKELGVKLYTG